MKNKYSDVENFNLQIFNHIKIRGNQNPYICEYKESDFCKPISHVLRMHMFACRDYTKGIPSKCLNHTDDTYSITQPGHCLHHLHHVFVPIPLCLTWQPCGQTHTMLWQMVWNGCLLGSQAIMIVHYFYSLTLVIGIKSNSYKYSAVQ